MIVERNIKKNYSFFVKSYLYCNNIYMMLVENFISFFRMYYYIITVIILHCSIMSLYTLSSFNYILYVLFYCSR